MRHNKVGRKLKRTASHRRSLLASLSTALIKHKKIQTTTAKAKETRRIIEPIITRARDAYLSEKSGNPTDVHARRIVSRFIRDKETVQMLFSEVAEKVGKRPGGYTRVLKLGQRKGDGAEMSVIELVDYNMAQDDRRRRARVAGQKVVRDRRLPKEKAVPAAAVAEKAKPEDTTPVQQEMAETQTPPAEEPATSEIMPETAAEAPKEEEPKA